MNDKVLKFWSLYYHLRKKVEKLTLEEIVAMFSGEEREAALYFRGLV